MDVNNSDFSQKCVNTVRVLAADTVQKANSGHPGAPMGCAPMAYVLWSNVMNFSPSNPKWLGRDRFVLSNGHGCALQYSMLHLTGYDLSLDDLKNFRQLGSKTPGHPENHITAGIEVSTGPLGQGISNAVGLAIGETHLAAKFNKPNYEIFNNYTYVICGDGCMQEGVSSESASLAGHLGLGKLIVLYDDNKIQIDGETDLAFTEDVLKRYEAYGWHTSVVANGDTDLVSIYEAIKAAQAVTDKPSLIKVRTTIGLGSAKQGTEKVHGSPLGEDDLKAVKTKFGFNPDAKFNVLPDVADHFAQLKALGAQKEAEWNAKFEAYGKEFPDLYNEIVRRFKGELPAGWDSKLPTYKVEDKTLATRNYSQKALEQAVAALPEFFGGCADLTPSTLTKVEGNKVDYQKDSRAGNYLRFGVREHAMASICNGLAAYGGFIPFASTFLNFTGYALGAVRLSALSHFHVIYIMTHDSIGVGEDGPTHQPIETLASLRSIPNMLVLRPCDGNETSASYKVALENKNGPVFLCFSRQNCANIANTSYAGVSKGAYPVGELEANPQVIITASGSEVQVAVAAQKLLKAKGVNAGVVSFPSWELFEKQSEEYKASVFPQGVPVLSVEAASVMGWEKYAHGHLGMTTFGLSGPAEKLFAHFGLTAQKAADSSEKLIALYKGAAPSLKHITF